MQTIPPEFEIQIGVLVREAMSLAKSMALQMVEDAFETGDSSLRAPVVPAPASSSSRSGKKKSNQTDKPRLQRKPRSPSEIAALGETFIAQVRAHPGEGMTTLASRVGVSSRELGAVVARLKREDKIRVIGSRNSARYFPAIEGGASHIE